MRLSTSALFLTSLLILCPPCSAEEIGEVSVDRLRADVEWLADPAREGRRPHSDGWKAARDWIASRFAEVGLEPLGADGSFFQTIPGTGDAPRGTNVIGILRASGSARGDHVLIGAHYDHLGVHPESEIPFPGADDNASGVAAILEIARLLAASSVDRSSWKRDIVFVAFDLEEQGLAGSRHYADHPMIPLDRMAAMICIDMLGRSILDQFPGSVVTVGAERSRDLATTLKSAADETEDRVWSLSTEYVGPRSDFLWFALRRIPYLWFTTATHRDYHQTTDTADRIDYRSLALHTSLVLVTIRDLVLAESAPRWTGHEPDALAEGRAILDLTGQLLARIDGLEEENQVTSSQIWVLQRAHDQAAAIVADGRVSDLERLRLIASAYAVILGVVDRDPLEAMRGRLRRLFGG